MTIRSSDRHQVEKDLVLQPEASGPRPVRVNWRCGPRSVISIFGCTAERVPADETLAGILDVTPGTELLLRTFRKADRKTGALHEWSVSYIPVDLIKGNPDIIDKADQPWPGGTQHQLYTVGIEVMQSWTRLRAPCLPPWTSNYGTSRTGCPCLRCVVYLSTIKTGLSRCQTRSSPVTGRS